jgi:hypothetical protein
VKQIKLPSTLDLLSQFGEWYRGLLNRTASTMMLASTKAKFEATRTKGNTVIKRKGTDSARLAYRWDGISQVGLQQFVGPYAHYIFWSNGEAHITVGYGTLKLKPDYYIWEDSDGYDSGTREYMQSLFDIVKDA